MATTITANYVRSRLQTVALPIDTTVAAGVINSGDMVYWTQNNPGGAASLTTAGGSNTNAQYLVGVSRDTYPVPVAYGITESGAAGNFPGVTTAATVLLDVEGDFQFKTTNAQTYTPFSKVYLGADGQTVSTVATGDSVGTVSPDQIRVGGSIGGTITGSATQKLVVHVIPNLS
jgi:hypothetical protein